MHQFVFVFFLVFFPFTFLFFRFAELQYKFLFIIFFSDVVVVAGFVVVTLWIMPYIQLRFLKCFALFVYVLFYNCYLNISILLLLLHNRALHTLRIRILFFLLFFLFILFFFSFIASAFRMCLCVCVFSIIIAPFAY